MPVGMNANIMGTPYPYGTAVTGEDGQKDLSGIDLEPGVTEVKTDAVNSGQKDDSGSQSVDSSGDSPPKPGVNDFPGDDFSGTLAKLDGFNMIEVLYALNQAAQEIRKAGREMRHAERDAVQSEAQTAADKIRSAARTNLLFGCISGGINIGMGVASIGMSAHQLSALKAPTAKLNAAKLEVAQQPKADPGAKLSPDQVKLNQAKAELAAKQNAVKDVEAQVNATKDLEATIDAAKDLPPPNPDLPPTDPANVKAANDIKTANDVIAAKEANLLQQGGPKYAKDLDHAKAEAKAAAETVAKLEADTPSSRLAAAEAEMGEVSAQVQARMGKVQGWNAAMSGSNQALQAVGQNIAAGDEAEKAEHTAESQKASSMEQESAEFQKAAEELMSSVRSILKEALQAYNQANAAVYRNM